MILPELGTYLDGDTSLTLGTDLFLGQLPESPDAAVSLIETGGTEPDDTWAGDNPAIEMPRVQITVRGAEDTYGTTRTTMDTVYKSLCKIKNQTLSGTLWLRCSPIDSPAFLMRDETNRPIFVSNFQVWKAMS